jgi:hypothetical protein
MRSLALALVGLAIGGLQAADTVGGGYVVLPLQPGIQFLGCALQAELVLETNYSVVTGETDRLRLTDARLPLVNDQFNVCTVELLTPAGVTGWMSDVQDTFASGKQVHLTHALPSTATEGGRLRLWRRWSLAALFGAANSAGLTSGPDLATSDVIVIPNAAGGSPGYYFYCTGGAHGTGWRREGAEAADQSGVTLPLTAGVALRARAAHQILLAGTLKPGPTRIRLQNGRNLVANLCPIPQHLTLANSGLSVLSSGSTPEVADLVLLWNGSGYAPYYQSTGALLGTGWRLAGGDSTDQSGVSLTSGAYAIERRSVPVEILLQQGEVGP